MEIKVLATSNNLLNNEVTLIKDGVGYLFNDDKLSYLEDGIESVRNEITWGDDEIVLTRSGSNSSVTKLRLYEYSTSIVTTMYGEMILDTFLIDAVKNSDMWYVEYKLFLESDLIGYIKVVWEIKGVN